MFGLTAPSLLRALALISARLGSQAKSTTCTKIFLLLSGILALMYICVQKTHCHSWGSEVMSWVYLAQVVKQFQFFCEGSTRFRHIHGFCVLGFTSLGLTRMEKRLFVTPATPSLD